MGVVLGIWQWYYVFFLKVYCCLIPTQFPPIETSILKLVVRALLLCVIRYSIVYAHTSWSPRKSRPPPRFQMSCTPYFVWNMAPMAPSLGNLAPCYETCKNLSMFHECIILDKSTWSNLGFMIWFITAKNTQLVQGWWKQPWTMLCCPHCSMLSTIL